MRPPVSPITQLEAPLTSLRGVGPTLAARLEQAIGGKRVLDLLLHLPERFAERVHVERPEDAPADRDVVLKEIGRAHV